MKRKKIIICILSLVLIFMIGGVIYFYNINKSNNSVALEKDRTDINPPMIEEDETDDEIREEDNNEIEVEEESIEEETTTDNSNEENKVTSSNNNSSTKTNNNTNKTTTNNNQNNNTNTNNNVVNNNKVENNNQTNTTTQTNEQTPWEKLGVSEYDYYNSPTWSWATVDFSIDQYGSKDACKNACINYGDNYLEEKGSGGYNCTESISLSGRYLGEHFTYKE